MKRLCWVWVVLWSLAAIRVPLTSVQPIQHRDDDGHLVNICSSFSINQAKGYWMTANHCFDEADLVGGQPVRWVAFSESADLAIYEGAHRPALKLAIKAPAVGDEVVLFGYPQGAFDVLTFFGRVSHPKARLTPALTAMVIQLVALGGDSGGPILDASGRVVAVAQNSNRAGVAWGVPFSVLQEFSPYWEP